MKISMVEPPTSTFLHFSAGSSTPGRTSHERTIALAELIFCFPFALMFMVPERPGSCKQN